ncbi:hypothetical protein HA402_009390 [Bradysia odoriphaga]|nr:hypothetical protein HA402_009390 [Bradysia odoriphaga]
MPVVIFVKYLKHTTMACAIMMKLLAIVAIFAIPIVSQDSAELNDRFGFFEMVDKLECKNASAAVLARQETLYQEFIDCVKNAVDIKMMNQDLRFILKSIITSMKLTTTLSDTVVSSIRVYSQSYCPKLNTLMKCEKTYSSIYKDCLLPAEVQAKTIRRDTTNQLMNYFCENNADELINLITGKFIECVMPRQMEMRVCLKTFFATPKMVLDNVSQTTNAYCKSIDDFFTCTTTILQQCVLSQSPGKLMDSLRSYIKTNGVCSTVGDTMNLKLSLV